MASDEEANEPALVSMKRSKAEVKKDMEPCGPMDTERYPYGLRISLQKDELEKLGITSLPGVGDTLELEATVKVVSVSAGASEGGNARMSMDLQITDMSLEPDTEADNKVSASIV